MKTNSKHLSIMLPYPLYRRLRKVALNESRTLSAVVTALIHKQLVENLGATHAAAITDETHLETESEEALSRFVRKVTAPHPKKRVKTNLHETPTQAMLMRSLIEFTVPTLEPTRFRYAISTLAGSHGKPILAELYEGRWKWVEDSSVRHEVENQLRQGYVTPYPRDPERWEGRDVVG